MMLCQLWDIECDVSGGLGGSEEEVVVACLKVLSCWWEQLTEIVKKNRRISSSIAKIWNESFINTSYSHYPRALCAQLFEVTVFRIISMRWGAHEVQRFYKLDVFVFRSAPASRLCFKRNEPWWKLLVSINIAYCLLEQLWCGIFCVDKTVSWSGDSAVAAGSSKCLTTLTNISRSFSGQQIVQQS